MAFFLSVEIASSNAGGALGASLQRAVQKRAHSASRYRSRTRSVARGLFFCRPSNLVANSTVPLVLQEAIAARREVEIVYFTASTGQRKTRAVQPHHLYHAHGDWYLMAFDVGRQTMLNFHVGRIESHRLSAISF